MSQAAIVINVSTKDHMHHNGLSGQWTVPGRKEKEEFAILVVFPTPETQDIGENKKTIHWLKARPLARSIVGLDSNAAAHTFGDTGTKEKWGLLLCEAEPDIPKQLLAAIEAEMEYLDENRPDYKYKFDNKWKATVVTDVSSDSIKAKKIELSEAVEILRADFVDECRKLVQKKEVLKAKRAVQVECQRLVAEGDRMWANDKERPNINELHHWGCTELGVERPWCYQPQQLVDCPGCGAKIKENILSCPNCSGWLDEGIEVLRAMPPRERKIKMYPNQLAEPVGKGK
jgi:hypothetical protein